VKTQEGQQSNDYLKFRGRCKELSEAAVRENPNLTLVRGHYFCPIWNVEEPHWWTIDETGKIYDPSARQFPSKGLGVYTPFSGTVTCEQCKRKIPEEEAIPYGNFLFCSNNCICRCVGV
jgi:hypothetical protein